MKKAIFIVLLCIIASGYLEKDTFKKEAYANKYSAFETISQKEIQDQRKKEELKMRALEKKYILKK